MQTQLGSTTQTFDSQRPGRTVLRAPSSRVFQTRREQAELSRSERADKERDLVARLLVDDTAAWRTFSAEYAKVVFGCIRRVLGRFTRVTSEHDVDEVYARFCFELLAQDRKKLRLFDPEKGSRLSTWVGMLATNATYDYLRRLKRERVCEPLPENDIFMTEEESPLEQVELRQRAALTAQVLDELSERDRQFVELYFGEGMSAEEVATTMEINLKTVYTKKHKITARLESILLQKCG